MTVRNFVFHISAHVKLRAGEHINFRIPRIIEGIVGEN